MSGSYYVPPKSYWPILTAFVVFVFLCGLGGLLNANLYVSSAGFWRNVAVLGFLGIVLCLFGWCRDVVSESLKHLYSNQLSRSLRVGMLWFLFSEVWFFAALFGALFYVRTFALPWLSGEGDGVLTHVLLWPRFVYDWPLFSFPDPLAGFSVPSGVIDPFHLPLWNTIILVISSLTLTVAHHAVAKEAFKKAKNYLAATVVLGVIFLVLQSMEYYEAYSKLNFQLDSGIYGSLFFLMTGFHGVHVLIGTCFLGVTLWRLHQGHFSADRHFGFEAASWYWHFVDVVWIILFFSVYLL